MTETNLVSRIDPETAPGALYAVRRYGILLGETSLTKVVNVMMINGASEQEQAKYPVMHFAVMQPPQNGATVIVETFLLDPAFTEVPGNCSSFAEPYIFELDRDYALIERSLRTGQLVSRNGNRVYSPHALFGNLKFSRGRLREL